MQANFRDKIIPNMQRIMIQRGFYPGDVEYDFVAMAVLSKTTVEAAKENFPLYTEICKKVSSAHGTTKFSDICDCSC